MLRSLLVVLVVAALPISALAAVPPELQAVIDRITPDSGAFSYRGTLTNTDFVTVEYVEKDGRQRAEMSQLAEPRASIIRLTYRRQPELLIVNTEPQSIHPQHKDLPYAIPTNYHVTPSRSVLSRPGDVTVDQTNSVRQDSPLPYRMSEDLRLYDPETLREQMWPVSDAALTKLQLALNTDPEPHDLPGVAAPASGHRLLRTEGTSPHGPIHSIRRDIWIDDATGLPTLIVHRRGEKIMLVNHYDWSTATDEFAAPTRVTSRHYSYAMGGDTGVLAKESVLEIGGFVDLGTMAGTPAAPIPTVVMPKTDPDVAAAHVNNPLHPLGGGPPPSNLALTEPAPGQNHWIWATAIGAIAIALLAHAWYRRRRSS